MQTNEIARVQMNINAQKEQDVTKGDGSASKGYQEQFIIERCWTYLKNHHC